MGENILIILVVGIQIEVVIRFSIKRYEQLTKEKTIVTMIESNYINN